VDYHKVLSRHIRKLLPAEYLADEGIQAFLESVSNSYYNFEKINSLSEHAFEVSEKEYTAVNSSLKQTKEVAEKAAQAKSDFLSTMSHEIRTPMNAVIGFTNLLQELSPTPEQAEYLKLLKFSAENLLVLINDILDFNKIEAGKIEFEEADYNLKDLINNIRLSLSQNANEKNIKVEFFFDNNLPPMVKGDSTRFGQILTNLINNAIKFTHEGSVTIRASLNSRLADRTVIDFEVADTGIGIEEEKLEHIFESFTQAAADTTRKFGGTGLGLAITRKLLEMMGSEINVKSEFGKGSVFYFTLSMKNSVQHTISETNNQPGIKQKSLSGLKILIADDNHINIIMIKQFMKAWDIECDTAKNGVIALELVKVNHYQLVLMDLEMPEMDGYQCTAEIRRLPGDFFKNLPIIALTASSIPDIKDKAYIAGMNDFVNKPFNPNELYRKIAAYSNPLVNVSGN
jgi:signal transduction histidine kinase/CheY-like chemotaxis protein